MNKRDRARMDRALSRAPAVGKCVLAPTRAALAKMLRLRGEHARMCVSVNRASFSINRTEQLERQLAALRCDADLKIEAYKARIAELEQR